MTHHRMPDILYQKFKENLMKTDYEFLTTEINGHILEVTINRPDVMNSLHPPSHREFDEVWSEFANNEDLWVGIITGAGDREHFQRVMTLNTKLLVAIDPVCLKPDLQDSPADLI